MSGLNPTTLLELLEMRAGVQADKTAFTFLVDGEVEKASMSYQTLAQQAKCIAAQLQKMLEPGERALLLLPSGLDYIAAFFGCLYAGVIAVPAYPPKRNRSDARLQLIATDAGASVVLTIEDILSQSFDLHDAPELNKIPWLALDHLPNATRDWQRPIITTDTLAFLQYTSGSTGAPKGVMVSHKNLLQNLKELDLGWGHTEQSIMVTWLPLFHDMGLIYGILEPIYQGFSCYLMTPAAFLQQPLRWLKAISRYGGTHTAAPNFAYELCTQRITAEQKADLNLSRWQMALNGAEPIHKDTLEQFAKAFASCGFNARALSPGYGLAEFTLKVTAVRDTDAPRYLAVDVAALNRNKVLPIAYGQEQQENAQVLVGCGRSETDTRIVIINPETLTPCADDEVGTILVAGDSAAQGYWQRSEETQHTFQAYTSDGQGPFLRTGDLGFLHDGELYVTGRLKDVIIIRGLNYYPQDIETVVADCHPALKVSASAAFSVPVDGREQLVVIQEVERNALKTTDIAEILGAVRLALAEAFEMQLYALVLLKPASISKTSSGKIQRRLCRERFLNDDLAVVAQWRRDVSAGEAQSLPKTKSPVGIQHWLLEKLAEILGILPEAIDINQALAYYGLDSLIAVTLSGELETWLGRKLSPTLFYDYPTIAAIADYLAQAPAEHIKLYAPNRNLTGDIAVIGLGCRFPGADNPDAFLELLRSGRQAINDMPLSRPDGLAFYQDGEMQRIRRGGFLNQVTDFDAPFFQIAPKEAQFIDPQQRLLLEVCWETLEHAGMAPEGLAGSRSGVFIGISANDYARLQAHQEIKPNAYSGSGQAFSMAANRLSYALDLQGPSFAVDTACSSSLVAAHQAVQSLRSGECDLALVGGVNLILSPDLSMTFVEAGMLSPDGWCKTFAADANGYVRGEGCGMVALKRLSDALKDNDNVLAVIKGSAINQDGRSNGLTAPNGLAQQQVLKQALQNAGVQPAQISLLETHGTGTALGDPIEVNALTAVLMEGRSADQACAIGSVKANIGHLEAAAGIAGLIKTVLSLQHGEIFPQPIFGPLNPLLAIEQTPIVVAKQARIPHSSNESYFAGISSFGFGGANAHVVLASASQQEQPASNQTQHLLTLSAKTETALNQLIQRYQAYLKDTAAVDIAALCYTTNSGRNHFNWRYAATAANKEELSEKLNQVLPDRHYGDSKRRAVPKIAFLFTGQGSQYPDMGHELYRTQPYFKSLLDQYDALLRPYLDASLVEILYSGHETQCIKLKQTRYAQPALFALEYALAQLWRSWGIKPIAVAGHSLGEYVAACIAGVFSVEDGLKLTAERGRLMQELPANGKMLAVFIGAEQLAAMLATHQSTVTIAAYNGPFNTVVSGMAEAVDELAQWLDAQKIKTHYLDAGHAFHSLLMKPMLGEFSAVAQKIRYMPPQIPCCSNVSGDFLTNTPLDADYWCEHILRPVSFFNNIQALINSSCNVFIEIGPKPVLSAMASQMTHSTSLTWLPSLKLGVPDSRQMLDSLAQLYRQGATVDWSGVHPIVNPRRLALPTYPFQRRRYWFEQSVTKPSLPQLLQQGDIQKILDSVPETLSLSADEQALLPKLLHKLIGADPLTAEQAIIADCLYQREWRLAASLTTHKNIIDGQRWLIFADRKGVAEALAVRLQAVGIAALLVYADSLPQNSWQGALSVKHDDDTVYDALFKQLQTKPPAKIVHLWALDCTMTKPLTAIDLQQVDNLTSIAVMRLLQALYRQQPAIIPRLTLVTQYAVACGDTPVNFLQAPLSGLAQTVALEHSDSWSGLIDIDGSGAAVDGLLGELLADSDEAIVALRQGERYCARLRPFSVAAEASPFQCDSSAAYLITGGLGALGLSAAQCLAAHGAKYLFLAGRSGVPSKSAAKIIDQLTGNGIAVTVLTADVSESQDVAGLLDRIAASGKRLKGVIHAAGVIEIALLLQQTPEIFGRVSAPKIAGTWHLHELTQAYPVDFFICFSSASAVLGSPGLSSYAAANAFMDALMNYRRSLGFPGLSINWGTWGDLGMMDALSSGQRQDLENIGINMLTTEQGLHLLSVLLKQQAEPQLLAASMNWELLYRQSAQPLSIITDLLNTKDGVVSDCEKQTATELQTCPIMADLTKTTDGQQRYAGLKSYVRQQVAGHLGFTVTQFEDDAGFSEMGMDSLTAVKLKNDFQQVFGQALPVTLLINYHNIQALTDYLYQRLFPGAQQPTLPSRDERVIADEIEELSEQDLAAIIASKLASAG